MKINPPIDMGGYDIASLSISKYGNGAMAVQAYTTDGEPACTVSVNIPDEAHKLAVGEFFLKHWSENELPVKALLARGIIEIVPDKVAASGFVFAQAARLKV